MLTSSEFLSIGNPDGKMTAINVGEPDYTNNGWPIILWSRLWTLWMTQSQSFQYPIFLSIPIGC